MENTYSVVHFLGENTVEAVPKIWVKQNRCAWPKSCTKPSRLIEKRIIPNDKEFTYFKIRELSQGIGSLSEAKSKAKRAELTSDLSDTCDNKANRKFKTKKISYSPSPDCISSESDDDCPTFLSDSNSSFAINANKSFDKIEKSPYGVQTLLPLHDKIKSPCNSQIQKIDYLIPCASTYQKDIPKAITPEKKRRNGWSPSSSTKKVKVFMESTTSNDLTNIICDVKSTPNARHDKIVSKNSSVRKQLFKMSTSETMTEIGNSASSSHDLSIGNEFEKRVLNLLVYIKVELKSVNHTQHQILERIDCLEKQIEGKANNLNQSDLSEVIDMQDCPLPIDGEVDLTILEDKALGDRMFKLNLIYELSCVGGKNAKAAVKRIMAKLFTNNFLKEYSFSGRKGKKKFSDLFICPLIIKAVKKQTKFKNTTNQEIEETIRTILAQAPFAEKYYQHKNKICI
ncbi:hypothetical protein ACI65C_005820 [Semiaphis heraclei]